MAQPAHQNGAKPEVKVSAAEVEAAVEAAAKAAKLPTAEVIGKQPMTQIFQGMYWCNVCTAGMNCEAALDMHLKGKKHLSKLKRVDSTMFLPHEPLGPLSKGPSKMKSSKKPQAAKVAVGATGAACAATEEKSFKCDICDCEFNNEIPYQAHMVGKKHQKKVNAPAINSMNSRFSCALCQFVGNSPTHLEAHLQGKNHAKKAGLPAPPPGPAQAPPTSEKRKKPYPNRHHPYFNAREHREKKSSSYPSNSSSTYDSSYNPSSYNTSSTSTSSSSAYTTSGGGFTSGGYYQAGSTTVSQVKPASSLTSADTANPAAYATGIVGNYGFSLYDK